MPLIIPVFILHQGCPHRCSYCNEKKAVGDYPTVITEAFFRETLFSYLRHNRGKKGPAQIAFYGGNFTGLDKAYQEDLLDMAGRFIKKGLADSIRISTRPDYIEEGCLELLKRSFVKTVEIGAQSMVDEVLHLSRRGHSSSDIRQAMALLNQNDFETGIHLMAGLPGDNFERFAFTVSETIALRPHMVRLHPTLVFSGTELSESFYRGDYQPLTLPEAISICKYALGKFTTAGIPVVRLGLQPTPEMEKTGSIVAGPFHPSFRSLVEEAIFFDMASLLLSGIDVRDGEIIVSLSPRDASSFRGQRNKNVKTIKKRFGLRAVSVVVDPGQQRGDLAVEIEGKRWHLTGKDFAALNNRQQPFPMASQ